VPDGGLRLHGIQRVDGAAGGKEAHGEAEVEDDAEAMTEAFGDLWDADTVALCLTTNGSIKTNGAGVMGRGIALQATRRYPGIGQALGAHLAQNGNHVGLLITREDGRPIYAFPVKHVWDQHADLQLIERSARELVEIVDELSLASVALPRPGCGNGGLRWEDVKPRIESILDDRFIVVEYAPRP